MKQDRMKGKKFFNKFTYNSTRTKHTDLETLFPEYYPKDSTKSLTTPGQSISIKELIERHEKGRPVITD